MSHRYEATNACVRSESDRPRSLLQSYGLLITPTFDVPALIAYCSTFTELAPGDVIVTGTTGGVGAYRTPPLWMKDGDTVEVEISGIGILRNPVKDEVAASATRAA